jgi:hypothetical protein
VWAVVSLPNFFVYQVISGSCKQISIPYNDYTVFFLNPVLYGLLPVSVLASFGYATHVNIGQLRGGGQQRHSRIERQLTHAIILQCISFVVSQVSISG